MQLPQTPRFINQPLHVHAVLPRVLEQFSARAELHFLNTVESVLTVICIKQPSVLCGQSVFDPLQHITKKTICPKRPIVLYVHYFLAPG
jgi:hypothetical protein